MLDPAPSFLSYFVAVPNSPPCGCPNLSTMIINDSDSIDLNRNTLSTELFLFQTRASSKSLQILR